MKKIIIIVSALVILIVGAFLILSSDDLEEAPEDTKIQEVQTDFVSNLSLDSEPIFAYGQVISSDSVAVVPEKSGVVKRVIKSLGQTVNAGETVIELQNSSEQQAVLQARSSLSSAQAQLIKVQEDADVQDLQSLQLAISDRENQLQQLQSGLQETAFSLSQDVRTSIYTDFDTFFSSPTTDPRLIFATPNASDTNIIVVLREGLQDTIDAFLGRQFPVPTTQAQEQQIIRDVRAYIDEYETNIDALLALVQAQPKSIISTEISIQYLNTLNRIKVEVNSKKQALTNSAQSLAAARNALSVAQNNFENLNEDPDAQDVFIAQNGVVSAQAGLTSAQIELAKTFITSPIFGRISSIETRVGQLVGPQNQVFVVSSSGSKRVDIFVSETEASRIFVGSTATINESISAQVARVSPTIDSTTGKIKIELFPTEQSSLTEGAGVRVQMNTTRTNVSTEAGFAIPIESVFVRGNTSFVYVVRDGKAVPQVINTEGLFGPTVRVSAGINQDDEIVLFARGVKDNQVIRVMEEPEANDTDVSTNQ